MKPCVTCKKSKSEDCFAWRRTGVKRSGVCRECQRRYRRNHYVENRQKYIDKARAWEESRGGKTATRYGLSAESLIEMTNRYGGKCWLCRENEAAVIDHDHACCPGRNSCGECIRGVVCAPCNKGLGCFRDRPDLLDLAKTYLNMKSATDERLRAVA